MEGGFNKVSKSGSPVWAQRTVKYSHFNVAYLPKKSLAAVMAARDLFCERLLTLCVLILLPGVSPPCKVVELKVVE